MPVISHRPAVSSTTKLLRIAAYIGVVGSTSVLIMKWFMDRKVRKSDYYVKATSHFLSYQPIVNHFGPPIYFGNIDLSDKENFTTNTEAQFKISIQGTQNRGVMYTKAIRREIDIDSEVIIPSSQEVSSNSTSTVSSPVPTWIIEEIYVAVDNRPGERVHLPFTPIPVNL